MFTVTPSTRATFGRCLAALLLTFVAVAGRAADRAADRVAAPTLDAAMRDKTIRVGMVNSLTGPRHSLGAGYLASAQAVFDDVNAQGGIHGRRLVLSSADDAYEPDQTVDLTLRLIHEDDVIALLGYVGSANASAILPLLDDMKIPLLGVSSGAGALRQPVRPYVFNTRASYAEEGEVLVDRLVKGGARKIGVVYQNDSFGFDALQGISVALEQRGLRLASSESYQRGTTAVRLALQAMLATRPDTVILAAIDAPAIEFIKQARAAGLRSRFASLSTFVADPDNVGRLQGKGERLLLTHVVPLPAGNDTPMVRECRRILARHVKEALGFVTLEGCINARILVRALVLAGPEPSRESVAASLEAMRAVDIGGLPVSFSPQNHQASDRVYLSELRGGRMVQVR